MLGEAPPEIKHPALIADEGVGSDSLNAEKLLREEIRSIRELWMRILQWGISVITGASTIIFYARRSVKDDLVASAVLKIGEPLPLKVYLIGTAFLFLLAYIFYKLADTAANRYRVYVGQLVQFKTSGIVEPTPTGRSVWLGWVFLYSRYLIYCFGFITTNLFLDPN